MNKDTDSDEFATLEKEQTAACLASAGVDTSVELPVPFSSDASPRSDYLEGFGKASNERLKEQENDC
ncbi:hypothetical protein ON010_g19008 [Phytophthora cinnamomi]|nr:hypothetical protein ON010_g19008 [Phytophthora cinnamomi]